MMVEARGRCVHDLVGEQCGRTPEAIAVAMGDRRLSYAELERASRELAGRLRAAGVGPEAVVGVALPRSPELLVTLLGILEAGGAFLPIDPGEPAERREFMLVDAGAQLLVTGAGLHGRVSPPRPLASAAPGNLAYVMYTSGSTGRPKGVMVQHDQLAGYLSWCVDAYEVASGSGAPLHSPVTFDLTITSLFAPLLCGRTVTVVPEEPVPGWALASALAAGGFSLVKLTPAHLTLLAEALPPEAAARATRRLVVGGEALSQEALAFWAEHAPDTLVVNEYGPTETVVGCCAHVFPAGRAWRGPVPIGTAIASAHLLVLDDRLEPMPDGEVGELFIGGPSVGRGYFGRPDLTAATFCPDPSPAVPGARVYRTGDLVRRDPEGQLVFVGRRDEQVKIRGYRIELGEIESLLAGHPDVQAVAVRVWPADSVDAKVAAYLVPRPGVKTSDEDVLAFAAERLPAYMRPAGVRWLPSLPMSPHGKVDRSQLPPLESTGAAEAPPATPTEAVLAELFRQLLDRREVGRTTSFFDMGGTSLQVARLIARLIRRYGMDMPPERWLAVPTVAGLARLIDVYVGEGRDAALALEAEEAEQSELDHEILEVLERR